MLHLTYQAAKDKLDNKRGLPGLPVDHTSAKLDHHTYLHTTDAGGELAVRLHNTDILVLHPDGRITLDSGGYRTVTTKDRLNKFLPGGYSIGQERGVWYLYPPATNQPDWEDEAARQAYWQARRTARVPFEDGLTLTPVAGGGYHVTPVSNLTAADLTARGAKITRYARRYALALADGTLGQPGPGDCFACQFGMPGQDHLLAHLDEDYLVPSLLRLALRDAGRRVSIMARYLLGQALAGQASQIDGSQREYLVSEAAKLIRRYLRTQLGMAA